MKGYRFSSLRAAAFLKPNGVDHRIICIPTVRDRLVQRIVLDFLMERPEAERIKNEASYGFIKSRGVSAARDRALQLRTSRGWAYKSDISSFFDSIPRDDVLGRAKSIFRLPTLDPILTGAASCEIRERNPGLRRIIRRAGLKEGSGVRQGMPLSPLFSNLILENFDRQMLKRGFSLVRYADDFIVLCENEAECLRADETARKLLQPLHLTLPPLSETGKTQIAAPSEPVGFLGLSCELSAGGSYQLLITQKQLGSIKARLSGLADPHFLVKEKLTISDVGRMIDARASGYRTAYACATNLPELEAILTDASRTIMRRLYGAIFGVPAVQKLSTAEMQILGLADFPKRREAAATRR